MAVLLRLQGGEEEKGGGAGVGLPAPKKEVGKRIMVRGNSSYMVPILTCVVRIERPQRDPCVSISNPSFETLARGLKLFRGNGGMKKGKSGKSKLQQQQNGHALPFKLSKLLDPDASWDKDQLGDVLHWIRQALGLLCGLLWGAVPLVGAIWIVVFLVLSSGIIYGYYAHVLKIDEEEFGGHGALLQEGLFASFSLFMLAWIVVYSLAHF